MGIGAFLFGTMACLAVGALCGFGFGHDRGHNSGRKFEQERAIGAGVAGWSCDTKTGELTLTYASRQW